MNYSLVGFFICVCLFSCTRERDAEETHEDKYYLIEDSKLNFVFKKNTYWIYQNDSSLIIDSVSLINVFHDMHTRDYGGHGTYYSDHIEYYRMEMKSFSRNQVFYHYLDNSIISIGASFSTLCQPIFLFNPKNEYNGTSYISTYPTYNLKGESFKNVFKFKITEQYSNEQFEPITYVYYNAEIGLIKWETEVDSVNIETWELVRWNIIR